MQSFICSFLELVSLLLVLLLLVLLDGSEDEELGYELEGVVPAGGAD